MNIEHIAFNVADPVAMAAWYTRHLGMKVIRTINPETRTHFIADESGRVVLELYHQSRAPVPDYFAMDPMILHIAFVAPDLRATRERLLAAGATSAGEPTATPNGDELAFLRDPWGLTIQLVKRMQPLLERGTP